MKIPAQIRDKAVVSRDVELALLKTILSDARYLAAAISQELSGDHFCYDDTRFVFQVAYELYQARGTADVVSVTSEITERKESKKAGEALLDLAYVQSDEYQFADYLSRIEGAYTVRQFYAALRSAEDEVFAGGLSLLQRERAMHESMGKMLALMSSQENAFMDSRQFAMYASQLVVRAEAGEVLQKQKCGIISFDAYIGGFVPGRVSVIGGRTSHGKTAFAVYLAVQQCRKLKKMGEEGQVLYFSAEMSHDEMSHRVISSISGVSAEKIGMGKCTPVEQEKVKDALEEMLLHTRISIDTNPAPTTAHMMSRAMSAHAMTPVRLIIFDYLEYSGEKASSEDLRLAKALRGGHMIAKRLGCPFIFLAQAGRGMDQKRRPQINDFRYSGFIEQVAALAMFVYYPSKHKEQLGVDKGILDDDHAYELLVRKNTHGPTGDIPMRFYPRTGTFIDPDAERVLRGEVMK